ncbi:hypothetical protein AWU65_07185 [Paenibacillus glucanolyticus]|uniref:Uncharacterized protein n=1 Tax=Paenibacillus glucanolyticus TaxID=59843 RepID=A0A163HYH8_9BACL|nr:hypothetical protein [Paenibacillus glucanolyticus]KZS45712.1 hypothetical protein AWU65_07185 [Paenibacillus glucanolyticus]
MPKRYKKSVYIEVLEFINTPDNHQEIIDFTGLPISVEYTSDGVQQLRVIRGAYSVLVAKLGECIVKEADGFLRVYTKEALELEYELMVTES